VSWQVLWPVKISFILAAGLPYSNPILRRIGGGPWVCSPKHSGALSDMAHQQTMEELGMLTLVQSLLLHDILGSIPSTLLPSKKAIEKETLHPIYRWEK
jgi:hypothetical protein